MMGPAFPVLVDAVERAAHKQHRLVHFMVHGGRYHVESVLFFENESGRVEPVKVRDFQLTVDDSVFLVTLNVCVSAEPGDNEFGTIFAFTAWFRCMLPIGCLRELRSVAGLIILESLNGLLETM
jgi:hypothetical protein